jgi:hypothetical protein
LVILSSSSARNWSILQAVCWEILSRTCMWISQDTDVPELGVFEAHLLLLNVDACQKEQLFVLHPPYLNNCENLPTTKPFSLTLSRHIANKQTNRQREKPRRCIQYSFLMPSRNTWQKNRQKQKGLKATRCIRWSCNALSQHTLQNNRQVGKGQKMHLLQL